MAKGNRGGTNNGGGGESKETPIVQKATKALQIENMNEAQLEKELDKIYERLDQLDDIMVQATKKTAWEKGMSEAFPLGAGGLNPQQARKLVGRENERSLNRAVKYVEAKNEYDTLEKRAKLMEKARKQVQGTGKTQKELNAAKTKKRMESALSSSSREWKKSTEKTAYGNIAVRKSGDYTIRTTEGTSFIYKGNRQIGMANTVKKAMGFIELYDERNRDR